MFSSVDPEVVESHFDNPWLQTHYQGHIRCKVKGINEHPDRWHLGTKYESKGIREADKKLEKIFCVWFSQNIPSSAGWSGPEFRQLNVIWAIGDLIPCSFNLRLHKIFAAVCYVAEFCGLCWRIFENHGRSSAFQTDVHVLWRTLWTLLHECRQCVAFPNITRLGPSMRRLDELERPSKNLEAWEAVRVHIRTILSIVYMRDIRGELGQTNSTFSKEW